MGKISSRISEVKRWWVCAAWCPVGCLSEIHQVSLQDVDGLDAALTSDSALLFGILLESLLLVKAYPTLGPDVDHA